MFEFRTDLALEAKEIYANGEKDDDGIESESLNFGHIEINRVKITNESGAEKLGKAMGTYITLEMPEIVNRNPDFSRDVTLRFRDEMCRIMRNFDKRCILVVGLGNDAITSDALGPKVVNKLLVTRHLQDVIFKNGSEFRCVCALAPGVLGTTGMETGEIIKGISEVVKPSIIVAVDALAARRVERVNTTIQISDTGLSPGAGVGNKRTAISEETLGIPVIAVGVPTVVDAATIAIDALEGYMNKFEKEKLSKELLPDFYKSLIVSPKNTDAMILDMARILSAGLNMAFQPSLSYEDASIFKN